MSNLRNLVCQRRSFARLDQVCQTIAARINQQKYDVAFVHPCRFSQSPAVLKYLTVPSVYLCQEPPRAFYEPTVTYESFDPPLSGKLHRSIGMFSKISGLLYAKRLTHFKAYDAVNAHHATLMLANSYYSKESLYRVYGRFPQVHYLGVDPIRFRPLPEVAKAHVVLCVGRFAPLKQHHFVVKSLSRLPEESRPAVVIIGDSSYAGYKNYLSRLADTLHVRLTMLEGASDDELVLWYNRATVVAYPPILEPLGLVALEAMACGTPVVGVREGGIRETILHEQTGLLVERDEQEFAQAIQRILSDPLLREQFGVAGRTLMLEQWSWKQSCDRLLNIFQAVSAGAKVRTHG